MIIFRSIKHTISQQRKYLTMQKSWETIFALKFLKVDKNHWNLSQNLLFPKSWRLVRDEKDGLVKRTILHRDTLIFNKYVTD